MKYKNPSKGEQEDRELEELENKYRKDYGDQPEASEDDIVATPVVDKEEETWKERYANLKSYSDKTKNELTKRLVDLEAKFAEKDKQSPLAIPTDKEGLKQWIGKYPDLASIIKTMIREDVDFLKEEIGPKLSELESTKNEIARDRAFAAVCKVHNDFPELINTPDFIEWIDRQPEEKGVIGRAIYAALHENETDSDAAIKAVNIYKQEKNFSPKRSEAREAVQAIKKTTSNTPETKDGKRTFSESQVEKMSIRDYEKFEDLIDEAKREGRFVYDLSGAAR